LSSTTSSRLPSSAFASILCLPLGALRIAADPPEGCRPPPWCQRVRPGTTL